MAREACLHPQRGSFAPQPVMRLECHSSNKQAATSCMQHTHSLSLHCTQKTPMAMGLQG